ncbi:MAG: cyclic nucleotide-binding domain-containing protein [Chloroflexi bacterium]|nr:cyclic nucleotide-binding domain-containing protein [Chloroflexota bacterium]
MVYRVDVKHIGHYLEEVDIFRGLTERHLERIAALCEEREFKEGDYLGVQNEVSESLYVITRGEIVVTTTAQGVDVVVRRIKSKETLPVAVLFEPPRMVTTAKATTDGKAIVIPRVRFMELCELEPRIGMHIYKAVCGVLMSRYRYTLERLAESLDPASHLDPAWKGAEV